MPIVYRPTRSLPIAIQEKTRLLLGEWWQRLAAGNIAPPVVDDALRKLGEGEALMVRRPAVLALYRQKAGQPGWPPLSPVLESWLQLKPMRSHSGIQTVAVLTKPYPCPGQCIFCPNDVRMPKSYLATEPGAQRAERNAFHPYLQTYNRLVALHTMGHLPSKIELIVLGGTWSDYPESYQIWFIQECFRALNDYSEGTDDRERVQRQIRSSVQSAHRRQNIVVDAESIAISGENIVKTYNQVVSAEYTAPEIRANLTATTPTEVATWDVLQYEHSRNETAQCRCVGLTLETRPDRVTAAEVNRLRRLGATRVQIGFQSLNDEVLAKNRRGHDTAAIARAVALLRRAGFKIHAHWMPNLYGSSPAADQADFHKLFHEPQYIPDELKIYPCTLVPSAELMAYYRRGDWQPYTPAELQEVLSYALVHTPPWVRLTRVVRDIPTNEMYMPHLQPNLRQVVEKQARDQDWQLQDIRAREIGGRTPQPPFRLETITYTTSVSKERFLQFVDAAGRLLGFLRLSLPNPSAPPTIPELEQHAIIRELHVYGPTQAIGNRAAQATQHQGLGTQLLTAAQAQARQAGYTTISVIAAVGTRPYYRQRGFLDGELYQHRAL